jgi:hypothetical protein
MNDVLAARFAALADTRDDSDWLDVRRRARRTHRRVAVAVAAGVAAVIATAAVAAGGGWIFSAHGPRLTAVTRVSLHGTTWRVELTRLCLRVSGGATAQDCGRALPPPFGARHVDVDGGQIWAGETVGFARRISIADAAGTVHTASAVKAPRGTKTPFRYWVIALDGTKATSITAYDAHGRTLRKTLH